MEAHDTIRLVLGEPTRARRLFLMMAIAGLLVFGLATGVLMAPHVPVVGQRLETLTCLQLAFTSERAAAVLGSFSPVQRDALARLMVPGDMVFAFGYGFLLSGLLGLVTLRLDPGWQRIGAVLMWAPLAASLFDCVEDTFLYQMAVAAGPDEYGLAPLVTGTAAGLKYLLLSAVTPLYGAVGSAWALRSDARPGSLVLYAVTVLTCLAMVARPLQQALGCW